MFPTFTIFNRPFSMYGVMAGAGIAAAMLYAILAARRRAGGITVQQQGDMQLALVFGLLGCVVGAKLLYLLTILPELALALSHSFQLFLRAVFSGGFVFYGGLYGFLLAVWLYARLGKSDFGRLMDLIAPVPALFHAFGRIGCFFAGCCYGKPTDSFLGVVLHSDLAPAGVPLIPVQLFEAAAEFILFGVLAALAQKKSGVWRLRFYLLAYSAFRFAVEFFRGDDVRGFLGPLSTSQVIALATIAVVALRVLLPRRGAGQSGAAA